MRFISGVAAALMLAGPIMAEPVDLSGTVGPYQIEAELSREGDQLTGRYRYAGKEAWIALSGEAFAQDALHLTERVAGEETGQMFFNLVEGRLEGVWVYQEAEHPATLTAARGAVMALFELDEVPNVGESLTGRYFVGGYWVNDLFAPNYEIGFNGGTVNVARIDADRLLIHFDFIVGPTYHIASFQGVAHRTGPNSFEHDAILEGGESPCVLRFVFEAAQLSVTDDNSGWACQFGARAHANFDLQKISDTAEFQENW